MFSLNKGVRRQSIAALDQAIFRLTWQGACAPPNGGPCPPAAFLHKNLSPQQPQAIIGGL
jgi:hypothetical protein